MSRLSMNTKLKEARIFDEDSWDGKPSTCASTTPIKREPIDEDLKTQEVQFIKQEPFDEDFKAQGIQFTCSTKFEIKSEGNVFCGIEHVKNFHLSSEVLDELKKSLNKTSLVSPRKESSPIKPVVSKNNSKNRDNPYKRQIFDSTSTSDDGEGPVRRKKKKVEYETDPEVLRRRQKQIDYGKNTIGYDNYLRTVPKNKRSRDDPQTPNKYLKYSRRGFDGLIKQWRLKLHKYDPIEK